jgi:hypothetical protein
MYGGERVVVEGGLFELQSIRGWQMK